MSTIEFDNSLVPADARVACDNCDWEGAFAEIKHEITDAQQRIAVGTETPAGVCPHCRALCYLIRPEPAPKRVLDWVRGGVADCAWEPASTFAWSITTTSQTPRYRLTFVTWRIESS